MLRGDILYLSLKVSRTQAVNHHRHSKWSIRPLQMAWADCFGFTQCETILLDFEYYFVWSRTVRLMLEMQSVVLLLDACIMSMRWCYVDSKMAIDYHCRQTPKYPISIMI